ncbi:hypothetical protein NDU88_006355 [Pleurodeles waltl]|uniref:Uncharacterized protein n=1 Tax=Pleurodeles waltl TaxID=8319 RepID=A0AAV7WAC1_PLEWA|nr:hypothetical protein NDU88_006355 [Pleurodeles waltl]
MQCLTHSPSGMLREASGLGGGRKKMKGTKSAGVVEYGGSREAVRGDAKLLHREGDRGRGQAPIVRLKHGLTSRTAGERSHSGDAKPQHREGDRGGARLSSCA